jgi:hypothetical protein
MDQDIAIGHDRQHRAGDHRHGYLHVAGCGFAAGVQNPALS